jgi:hypothetical protein
LLVRYGQVVKEQELAERELLSSTYFQDSKWRREDPHVSEVYCANGSRRLGGNWWFGELDRSNQVIGDLKSGN